MNQSNSTGNAKNIALRKIAWRSGTLVSAIVYSMFFFSTDATLAGLSSPIRMALSVFFTALTSGLGWLYFRDKNLS
jgi:hypothetical protein